MIMRKLGFDSVDFNNLNLPELYLRLCLADTTAYRGDI